METIIQSIVFPSEEKLLFHPGLFYRGERSYLDRENQELYIGRYIDIDFATYFNGCSYKKWMKYTSAKKIKLQLEIEGDFRIIYTGYHLDLYEVVRTEFEKKIVHTNERTIIEFEYPDNEETIVGFDISSLEYCKIYSGKYIAISDEKDVNEINLAIATTTCKKEDFILKNIEKFKKELLDESKYEYAKNIYVNVIDNGRTLDAKGLSEGNLKVIPNKNVGGSGGFARGMLEALKMTESITNVLLMDDDVLVMPDSIKRTYALLRLMKPEYQEYFISGAMMLYEEANVQHEDIGTFRDDCYFIPLKPRYRQEVLWDNLMNEGDFLEWERMYAAWWYCCIPVKKIKENGLPLPIFVRVDDCEYSLRCNAKFLSMNGVCIWHMGFAGKYNTAMEQYQQFRNWFILKSLNDRSSKVKVLEHWNNEFKKEILRYNYGSAEHVVKALEDYLKGPEFIEKDQGEKILFDNLKLNEKLQPLKEIGYGHIDLGVVYVDKPRKFIDKCIYHATWNGQRLWPKSWLRKEVMPIPYDWGVVTQKQTLRKTLLAVNPHNKTGHIREQDRDKFNELYSRFKKAKREYIKNSDKVQKAYRDRQKYLVSEEFWRKYLELN